MSTTRGDYGYALERWDDMRRQEKYSAPSHLGRVAIFAGNYSPGLDPDRHVADREYFVEEAEQFVQLYEELRPYSTVYIDKITPDTVASVLDDKSIHTMFLIGHGSLNWVAADDGQRLDWRFVSRHATHLKTGHIVQRFCGHLPYSINVPFGLFAAAFPSRVLAPVGKYFGPEHYPPEKKDKIAEEERKVRPIVDGKGRLEFDDIVELYSKSKIK